MCSPPKHVCGHVLEAQWSKFSDRQYAPLAVDCGGVEAAFVRVSLPGKRRILDAKIEVHRHRPKAGRAGVDAGGHQQVCYGLQAGNPTTLLQQVISCSLSHACYSCTRL